jgi:hypothetical protein
MRVSPTSDFERHGFAGEPLSVQGRPWLLTVDFEAFDANAIGGWNAAMHLWAEEAERAGLRFSLFTSVEDVVRLKLDADAERYAEFFDACRHLDATGSRFHPHNHCLFDPETGARASEPDGFPTSVAGYPRFPSLVYDVKRRHGVAIASWLPLVVREHERFLRDAGLVRPATLAFRAGGWDYGTSAEEMGDFLEGVARAGLTYDSSARCGTGEAPGLTSMSLGRNVFRLRSGVVEVAATDHVNCGLVPSLGRWLGERLREGVLSRSVTRASAVVTVLHFDHLFHAGRGSSIRYFAVTDPSTVRTRIQRLFRTLRLVGAVRSLESVTFDDLGRFVAGVDARRVPSGDAALEARSR